MENEKKLMDKVTEIEKKEVKEKEVKEEVVLYVEREEFISKDGNTYYSYYLKGKIRDRYIKVDFSPKDAGGYEVLDILFDVQPKAKLIIGDEEMIDSTGAKTKYKTYTLKTVDEDGNEYSCSVKPSRDSDKALLNMLLMISGKKN